MATGNLVCQKFTDFLIRKSEHLDEEIVKIILPTDQWAGAVETGQFPARDGTSHTFDRMERVVPDLTGAWAAVSGGSCIGTPCDWDMKTVGFGSTRDSYQLYRRSYSTQLYCFDLINTADKAVEQFRSIIENLKEVTVWVTSDWHRHEALRVAGKKWLATATMADFTFTWNTDNTEMTVSGLPTSKLTGPMLQRRVQPQISAGAMGMRPVGTPMLLELVTDMDTLWWVEQGNTTTNDKWRFTDFNDASEKFYKLGWAGKIGNYAVRVDLFPMRFQLKNGAGLVLQRKFPFKTEATTNGIRSVPDPNYDLSPYQISFIHHRKAFRHLVHDMSQVNGAMPFLNRDLAGKWQFVMDNLGADASGCVINNMRRNKGLFYSDYEFATKAEHPEWEEAVLHLREPQCVSAVTLCDTSLLYDYDSQDVDSANDNCARVFIFTPDLLEGVYEIDANTIQCNGQPLVHIAVSASGLGALVTDLTTDVSSLGTWAVVSGSTTQIQLTTTGGCTSVNIPWVIV